MIVAPKGSERVRGKKISVIGAAESGGAVAELMARHNATVFVSDSGTVEKLAKEIESLEDNRIPYEIGGHTERVLDCEMLVVSPGVPRTIPILRQAEQRTIPIHSEIEVASWFCKGDIVGITGSNGKTTTTALAGELLRSGGIDAIVAGNISPAFSAVVESLSEQSIAVLELSSFQLERPGNFRPRVSSILNVFRNHLDRYNGSIEDYASAKANIFRNQRNDDVLIYNADNGWCARLAESAACEKLQFSIEKPIRDGVFLSDACIVISENGHENVIIHTSEIGIQGPHNVANAMAAILIAKQFSVSTDAIAKGLRQFRGLEHRVEFVRELNGVRYFNDSKATDVAAVQSALRTFTVPVILLMGGRDKGNEYDELLEDVRRHVKRIVGMGESADKIERYFASVVPFERADSMQAAVEAAQKSAVPGEVVLLSPACASFDWFKNYEQRGEVFKSIVNQLA